VPEHTNRVLGTQAVLDQERPRTGQQLLHARFALARRPCEGAAQSLAARVRKPAVAEGSIGWHAL
jgi:hypothetical protein